MARIAFNLLLLSFCKEIEVAIYYYLYNIIILQTNLAISISERKGIFVFALTIGVLLLKGYHALKNLSLQQMEKEKRETELAIQKEELRKLKLENDILEKQ